MSESRLRLNMSEGKKLQTTSFYGGQERGRMYQITTIHSNGDIPSMAFTELEAIEIIVDLINWLNHD